MGETKLVSHLRCPSVTNRDCARSRAVLNIPSSGTTAGLTSVARKSGTSVEDDQSETAELLSNRVAGVMANSGGIGALQCGGVKPAGFDTRESLCRKLEC